MTRLTSRSRKHPAPTKRETSDVVFRDPIELGSLYLSSLPLAVQPHYETYLRMMREHDYVAAKKLEKHWTRPEFWADPADYKRVVQGFALLSKVPFSKGSNDRRSAALETFRKYENKCRRSNRRLAFYNSHPNRMDPTTRVVMSRAKQNVRKVLGSLDHESYRTILEGCYFGKGMTLSSTDSERVTLPYKLVNQLTTTEACRPVFADFLRDDHHWLPFMGSVNWAERTYTMAAKVVPGCRLSFVPKDASTLRTIAIEPMANVFCQLGIHSYLVRRLRRVTGIDLRDQTRNQMLAHEGSLLWESLNPWCTVDLSSASDCVSRALVEWLLPSEWFALFSAVRSPGYTLDGVFTPFEKWSSMGNGTTFVLETIVFWALAAAVASWCGSDDPVYTYGDDLVVRRNEYALLKQVLSFAGFEINTSKTFAFGPFRESCGKDYHCGAFVRPIYVKKETVRVQEAFNIHNSLWNTLGPTPLTEWIADRVPEDRRFFGPKHHELGAYLFTEDESKLRRFGTWHEDWQTFVYRGLETVPVLFKYPAYLMFISRLRGGPSGLRVPRRNRVKTRVCSLAR